MSAQVEDHHTRSVTPTQSALVGGLAALAGAVLGGSAHFLGTAKQLKGIAEVACAAGLALDGIGGLQPDPDFDGPPSRPTPCTLQRRASTLALA